MRNKKDDLFLFSLLHKNPQVLKAQNTLPLVPFIKASRLAGRFRVVPLLGLQV